MSTECGQSESLPMVSTNYQNQNETNATNSTNPVESKGVETRKGSSTSVTKTLDIRDNWSNRVVYLLSIIGFVVDLGNVWRFPTTCYRNGGGAFLLPYFTFLFLVGLPCMYMELAIGQYHRLGYLTIWNQICPPLKGIGYAMLIINLYVLSYYNTIIAWSVHYGLASFRLIVPWTYCNNEWNTDRCYSLKEKNTPNLSNHTWNSSAQEYFERRLLKSHLSSGIDDIGSLQWELVGCSVIVFSLIYLSIFKGVKTAGKAIWFTALIPYVILIILIGRSVTLDGIFGGLKYYIAPDFQRLKEYGVWQGAAVQIFFSLGPGFGVLLSYASFSARNDRVSSTALTASLVNCFTSFMYGAVVFAGLGYLSKRLLTDIRDFTGNSMGLVFIVYPEILASIRWAPVFSVLFFLMVLTLGLDSVFAGAESVYTAIADEYPIFARRPSLSRGLVVLIPFLFSLPTLTHGGKHIVDFMDFFGTSPSIMFVVLCELVATVWFYGMDKFNADVESMTGQKPSIYWRITCQYIAPGILATLYICSFIQYESSDLSSIAGEKARFRVSVAGWTMSTISALPIPIYAVWWLIFRRGKTSTNSKTSPEASKQTPNQQNPEEEVSFI